MLEFHADRFVGLFGLLAELQHVAAGMAEQSGADYEVNAEICAQLTRSVLDPILKDCVVFGLTAAHRYTEGIKRQIETGTTAGGLQNECKVIRQLIENDLKDRHFLFVVPEKDKYLQNWDVWAPVWKRFPSTALDVSEGVTCYVMERNTACVFHMMLVLEWGLAALARSLKVRYARKGWDNAIERIETKIQAGLRSKNQPLRPRAAKRRAARLTFFSEAAKEFTYFKEAWRNHTAHGRKHYDEFEAARVITHVRDFMIALSKQLKESKLP